MLSLPVTDTDVIAARAVVIDGVEVGVVRHRHVGVGTTWVAQLQLGSSRELPALSLTQISGTGPTAEQAVKNAIHVYRGGFRRALVLLEEMDERMRSGS